MWRSVGSNFALLCICTLVLQAYADPLPPPCPVYYTVVSASFGNLLYSMHYEEYGNSSSAFSLTVGRYYAPNTIEWVDVSNNRYLVNAMAPGASYRTCTLYQLNVTQPGRIVQGSTALLVNLINDGVQFNNMGLVKNVRSQNSVRYTAQLSWASSSNNGFVSLETFLKQALAMASVSSSDTYQYSVDVEVYYLSDANGKLLSAGGGAIPLRYSISGQRNDGHPLNIQYDFMQYTTLDAKSALVAMRSEPYYCNRVQPINSLPPVVAVPQTLQAPNTTLPYLNGGHMMVEVTASNHAALQFNALLRPQHGQELLVSLVDPTAYSWTSYLFDYDFADERDFQFAAGAAYQLNGTMADPFDNWDGDWGNTACSGSAIAPSTVSPLQWLDSGMLNTIFADEENFFAGAQPISPQSVINGIPTDAWTVKKVSSYNGVLYNFTVTMYVTASGWGNLGRTAAMLERQLLRLSYSGTSTNAKSEHTSYTLQMDFFMQFTIQWLNWANYFDPQRYSCARVATGQSMLPILPQQFSVSVTESWAQSWYSEQYTVYQDTKKNLRRVDGRFAAPNTISILSNSPFSNNFVSLMEWSQNVTVTGGFSAQSVAAGLPYTMYSPSDATPCGDVTLAVRDFSNTQQLNFFDWLAQADPSQAQYEQTTNRRGVNVDMYQLSMTTVDNYVGLTYLTQFEIYYLASDETTINNVPVSATAYVRIFNTGMNTFRTVGVVYEFFNFRSNIPPGIFNSPAPVSCTSNLQLPVSVAQMNRYYSDPDPTKDNTPQTAPTWPAAFSMIIEGPLFQSIGDQNIYIARWYADFNNFRERLDIEPAFNISSVGGVPYVQQSYLYYYKQQAGNTFSFSNGVSVSYTGGSSCSAKSLTPSDMNPLKQVAPGTLFDTFFPATTQAMSASSIYNTRARYDWHQALGIYLDEYDWNMDIAFAGNMYTLTQVLYVSIPEWNNNLQAAPYNNTRIPLGIQAQGIIVSKTGQTVASYSPNFAITHYQPVNPGVAMFDAALLGCSTTPDSPWYNIYGSQSNSISSSSDSSVSTATVVGAVVGVGGGLLLLGIVIRGYFFFRNRSLLASKYEGGKRSGPHHSNDNELVGVGKLASDDNGPENSLNHASLNNLVKEGTVEVEVDANLHTSNTTD